MLGHLQMSDRALRVLKTLHGNPGGEDGDFVDVGMPVGQDSYTDGAWVTIRVEVQDLRVDVYWDGTLVTTEGLPTAVAAGRVGVSAGTGAYSSEFSVRNFVGTPG